MKFETHCWESLKLFGKPYEEVHRWLDEFAGSEKYGMRHRKKRHHVAGIREAERLFGKGGAMAARRHIMSDLKMEGWKETDPLPKDEEDYLRMGFYW